MLGGARLQDSQMEGGESSWRVAPLGLWGRSGGLIFPPLPTSFFHLDTFPLAVRSPHKVYMGKRCGM